MDRFLLLLLSSILLGHASIAQDDKYEMSAPIEFNQTGWNKVLCMKNGNTFLFHFEPSKPLEVKVFDSLHKRIASQEYVCSALDINLLRNSEFKGLFELNGEAVMFVEQEHLSRFGLVRMRFNGKNGKLVEEKWAGESPSIAKRTKFYVMKNRGEENYAIFFCTDVSQFQDCNAHVSYYNSSHELVKDVPLPVDRKKYDFAVVACAESKPNGICVVLDLQKLVVNKTLSSERATSDVYDHTEAIYYIAKGADKPNMQVVDMSTDVMPDYSEFSYNAFAQTVNLLVFSYSELYQKFGIEEKRGIAFGNMFFKLSEDNSDIKLNWVKNDKATAYLQHKTDSLQHFEGIPLGMYTNGNGLTTLISEGYERYDEAESGLNPYVNPVNNTSTQRYVNGHPAGFGATYDNSGTGNTYGRNRSNAYSRNRSDYNNSRNKNNGLDTGNYNWNTYFGNICITQLDDDGNELWGTVLPHAEYLKSFRHTYRPEQIAKKDQSHRMFDDLPDQVTQRQFVSLNTYEHNKNMYIIVNDNGADYQNIRNPERDTVFKFENTNACYYKMDSKKEITKNYLLGTPGKNEYKCSFIEGADFDEERGVYATLVQYKRNDNISLRMAWARLD